MTRLTKRAHTFVAETLRDGSTALDGTAGRGNDTLFLAQHVGNRGRVLAFDLQGDALEATRRRLSEAGQLDQASLFLRSHDAIEETLREEKVNHIDAAMFNLGYLPRSDHKVRTELASTLKALDQSWHALSAGGILTVLCYRGHEGGEEEYRGVLAWFKRMQGLAARSAVEESEASALRPGPVLLALWSSGS